MIWLFTSIMVLVLYVANSLYRGVYHAVPSSRAWCFPLCFDILGISLLPGLYVYRAFLRYQFQLREWGTVIAQPGTDKSLSLPCDALREFLLYSVRQKPSTSFRLISFCVSSDVSTFVELLEIEVGNISAISPTELSSRSPNSCNVPPP